MQVQSKSLHPIQKQIQCNYRMLGSPDLYKVIKTGERFSFDITFNPVDKSLLSKGYQP